MSVEPLALLVDGLAVFRLALFIAEDAFPPMMRAREWLLARWPSDDTLFHVSELANFREGVGQTTRGISVEQVEPRSEYFVPVYPRRWSKLITCIWCLSIWLSALAIAGRVWLPAPWSVLATILALSAVAGLLNLLRTGR